MLTPAEILRHTLFQAPLPEPLAVRWAAAEQAAEAKNYTAALAEYAAIAESAEAPADFQAAARLRLGRLATEQKQPSAAAAAYSQILDLPGVGRAYRAAALTALLQLLPQVGAGLAAGLGRPPGIAGAGPPRPCVGEIPVGTPAPPGGPLPGRPRAIRPTAGDGGVVAASNSTPTWNWLTRRLPPGILPCAKPIRESSRTPQRRAITSRRLNCRWPPVTSGNRTSRRPATHTRSMRNPARRAQYHRWEAREGLQEIARLQAGLPARDPLRWRQQVPHRPAPAMELYVAPDGVDTQPGSQDKPIATLERVRDRIRELKRQSGLPPGSVTVYLRGGTYPRTQTFSLTAEDWDGRNPDRLPRLCQRVAQAERRCAVDGVPAGPKSGDPRPLTRRVAESCAAVGPVRGGRDELRPRRAAGLRPAAHSRRWNCSAMAAP